MFVAEYAESETMTLIYSATIFGLTLQYVNLPKTCQHD